MTADAARHTHVLKKYVLLSSNHVLVTACYIASHGRKNCFKRRVFGSHEPNCHVAVMTIRVATSEHYGIWDTTRLLYEMKSG